MSANSAQVQYDSLSWGLCAECGGAGGSGAEEAMSLAEESAAELADAEQTHLFEDEPPKPKRHPWVWLLKKVLLVDVTECPDCGGRMRWMEVCTERRDVHRVLFTQAQLFAILALRTFFKTDFRGVVAILGDSSELRQALGLKKLPHYSTLCKASKRLEERGATAPFSTAA